MNNAIVDMIMYAFCCNIIFNIRLIFHFSDINKSNVGAKNPMLFQLSIPLLQDNCNKPLHVERYCVLLTNCLHAEIWRQNHLYIQ